ncbi:MAG: hypothetical protein GWP17_00495 [Aquificales bacterium]|nr:hypothetical protein [Aquificales bacterium]
MTMKETAVSPQRKYLVWMLLVMLTAVFLRLYALSAAPPGLTHDEADHGITAWSIVNGARGIYFTIGYGREPLFDYATALLMATLGPTFLAGRLTAVFSSFIMIVGMAAWVRRGFDWQTAVLTAAGLAVGFWPVMTARQSLRSETLPALFVLAVYLFWRGLEQSEKEISRKGAKTQRKKTSLCFLGAGILLGLTFYTYIPARILWLVFPATVVYLVWQKRPLFHLIWKPTSAMLGVALLTALPLLRYLLNNPEAESRIGQLSQPLSAAAQGDFSLLWQHFGEGLGIIAVTGDSYWRYNIAGQPLLPLMMALLFLAGLVLAGWWIIRGRAMSQSENTQAKTQTPVGARSGDRLQRIETQEKNLRNLRNLWLNKKVGSNIPAASFLAVGWLILGLSPVLVTGASLSTTQAIGMQPVLYLFPALALRQGVLWLTAQNGRWERWAFAMALLILGSTAVLTFHRYFHIWTNQPQVRVEYETTLVTALNYLNEHGNGKTAVSTITPNLVHSPAVAAMTLHNSDIALSWFDGRSSLLLPAGTSSTLVMPGFTPLNPALAPYFETAVLATTLPLQETDLDRPLEFYQIDGDRMREQWAAQFTSDEPVAFGENATFLGYDLHTPTVKPGDVISIATWWQMKRPFPDGVLFTQILGAGNQPIAQADYLNVPSDLWQAGDQFIQLHQMTLPAGTPPGQYAIIIGLYSCPENCPAEIPPQPIATGSNLAANSLVLPINLTVTNE